MSINPLTPAQLTLVYRELAPRVKRLFESASEAQRKPLMWFLQVSCKDEQVEADQLARASDSLLQEVFSPATVRQAFEQQFLHPKDGAALRGLVKRKLHFDFEPNLVLSAAMAWVGTPEEMQERGVSSVSELPTRREALLITLRAHGAPPLVGGGKVQRFSPEQIEICLQKPFAFALEAAQLEPASTTRH